MKNTIRCCISCIIPCGALDVIRIVHANGRVEEISGSVRAADILKAYPKHVLKKPSSPASGEGGCCPKIVIVPPEAELRRGKIYFLMPVPEKTRAPKSLAKKKRKEAQKNSNNKNCNNNDDDNVSMTAKFLISDRYLSEILSEKLSTQKDRRRGRAGVWRPHLESISETPSDV